jgi:hypothetical protein
MKAPVAPVLAALVSGVGLIAGARAGEVCAVQLQEIEEITRENDAAIPSASLNEIFTLRQQAREACAAGADQIAGRLIARLADVLSADIDSARLDAFR